MRMMQTESRRDVISVHFSISVSSSVYWNLSISHVSHTGSGTGYLLGMLLLLCLIKCVSNLIGSQIGCSVFTCVCHVSCDYF